MDGVHIHHRIRITMHEDVLILVVMDGVHIRNMKTLKNLGINVLILVVMDGVHIPRYCWP